MKKHIQDEVQMLKEVILATVPVEQIFLFGSYAKGTPHDDSDIDILVVIPESSDLREIDAMKLINKAIRDKKTVPVDVIAIKQDKFNERKYTPSIERQIVQEGKVLYS